MFEKVAEFIKANESKVIKTVSAIVGAAIGMAVASVVVSNQNIEELPMMEDSSQISE